MKRNEQTILVALVVVGLLAAFWLVILSPKRSESSTLQDEVDQLQSQLSQAQQESAAGDQARRSFRVDYRRLVVLGKAVPADSEQASLLVQLQALASRSDVDFQSIDLSQATGTAPVPAPVSTTTSTDTSTTTSTGTATDTSTSTDSSTSSTAPSAPAVASESAAATLPLGASVGPAGLPVMPYELSFSGGFFQIADFMERLDGMVHMRDGLVDVNGRLLTVDGFTLTPVTSELTSTPVLTAKLSVTTFLTPADQGVTAGATPVGPAPATPTLASSTSTVPTDTTTAP
jgi:type II secretory pathway pseudopilin PulG